jgi:hypothetical protein
MSASPVTPNSAILPTPAPAITVGTYFPHRGCCIFEVPGFQVFLLAELVYGTPVQAG